MRMKAIATKPFTALCLAAALFALPAPAAAQTDFSGSWTLDKDLSADLTKATFVPVKAQTSRSPGGFSGGSGGSGGFGGRGGFGGGRRSGSNDSRASGGSAL